jgi:hypothetical protein
MPKSDRKNIEWKDIKNPAQFWHCLKKNLFNLNEWRGKQKECYARQQRSLKKRSHVVAKSWALITLVMTKMLTVSKKKVTKIHYFSSSLLDYL